MCAVGAFDDVELRVQAGQDLLVAGLLAGAGVFQPRDGADDVWPDPGDGARVEAVEVVDGGHDSHVGRAWRRDRVEPGVAEERCDDEVPVAGEVGGGTAAGEAVDVEGDVSDVRGLLPLDAANVLGEFADPFGAFAG